MESQGAGRADSLRFRVLGPLKAWLGDQRLSLGSPQQQAVLAMLLLRRGRPVTTEELVDGIWGDQPPPQAVAALRTYVSRLRAVIEPNREARKPAQTLVSVSDGYALRLSPSSLDLNAFELQVTTAKAAKVAGDFATAHELLRSALALWQGSPLAGLPGPDVDSQRALLIELQIAAREDCLEAALEIGQHVEILTELRVLATEHPLRERLRELLMLALYRSGRRDEALSVYSSTRRLLIGELGVEPGIGLASLHRQILASDPGLLNTASPALLIRPSWRRNLDFLPPDDSTSDGPVDAAGRFSQFGGPWTGPVSRRQASRRAAEIAARLRDYPADELTAAAETINGGIADIFLRIGPPPSSAAAQEGDGPQPGGTNGSGDEQGSPVGAGSGVGGGRRG